MDVTVRGPAPNWGPFPCVYRYQTCILPQLLQRETIQERQPAGKARETAGDHQHSYCNDKRAARDFHGVKVFLEAAIEGQKLI